MNSNNDNTVYVTFLQFVNTVNKDTTVQSKEPGDERHFYYKIHPACNFVLQK